MKHGAIVILWAVAFLNAGGPVHARARSDKGTPTERRVFRPSLVTFWDRGTADRADQDEPNAFVYEEEDEDDGADDEVIVAWTHGQPSAPSPFGPGLEAPGRRRVPVHSRSAAPTLRLRC